MRVTAQLCGPCLSQRDIGIGDWFRRRYKLSRCLGLEQERLHRHGFLRSVVIANGEFDPAALMARVEPCSTVLVPEKYPFGFAGMACRN